MPDINDAEPDVRTLLKAADICADLVARTSHIKGTLHLNKGIKGVVMSTAHSQPLTVTRFGGLDRAIVTLAPSTLVPMGEMFRTHAVLAGADPKVLDRQSMATVVALAEVVVANHSRMET